MRNFNIRYFIYIFYYIYNCIYVGFNSDEKWDKYVVSLSRRQKLLKQSDQSWGKGAGKRYRLLCLSGILRILKFALFSFRTLYLCPRFPFQSLNWSKPRAGSSPPCMPVLVRASHRTSGWGTEQLSKSEVWPARTCSLLASGRLWSHWCCGSQSPANWHIQLLGTGEGGGRHGLGWLGLSLA